LKILGLTGPQFHVLHTVSLEGSCKITYLAELLEVTPSAITVMVDRLVHNGFVIRTPDDKDRRVVLISITDEGHEVLRLAKEAARQAAEACFSVLEPQELAFLERVFSKIAPSS